MVSLLAVHRSAAQDRQLVTSTWDTIMSELVVVLSASSRIVVNQQWTHWAECWNTRARSTAGIENHRPTKGFSRHSWLVPLTNVLTLLTLATEMLTNLVRQERSFGNWLVEWHFLITFYVLVSCLFSLYYLVYSFSCSPIFSWLMAALPLVFICNE